jgi:ankyrin repeat protein
MHPDDTDPLLIAVGNGDILTVMEILDEVDTDEKQKHLNEIRYCGNPLLSFVIHTMSYPKLYPLRPQYEDIISQLLSKGVNPCTSNRIGRNTPFHDACENGLFSVVLILLLKGVDVLVKNGHGETPLHLAAGRGHVQIVSLISVYFPDISLRLYKDNEGNTPLHEAASEGQVDTVRLLLFKGADRYITNNDGRTAEDLAIKYLQPRVVNIMNNGV